MSVAKVLLRCDVCGKEYPERDYNNSGQVSHIELTLESYGYHYEKKDMSLDLCPECTEKLLQVINK